MLDNGKKKKAFSDAANQVGAVSENASGVLVLKQTSSGTVSERQMAAKLFTAP